VEIRYFTSGIIWSADYVAESEKNEKTMTLAGAFRINNNSGEDYETRRCGWWSGSFVWSKRSRVWPSSR